MDQQRSPDIDEDVTGGELDRATLRQVQGLDERQADWVSKHLVMAGRLIDVDPEESFQHALAASRRGGRLACVREAVALTAYAAGHYDEALREFRTYRRITGDDTHVAAQVDCERALGRLDKALSLAGEVDQERLTREARVELAMVVSGVHEEQGDLDGALAALQIPELDRRRGYPFSPRLFQRHSDVLGLLGRREDARQWQRYVRIAEKALGMGGFADPDIMDIDTGPSEEEREERRAARAAERAAAAAAAAEQAAVDQETSSTDEAAPTTDADADVVSDPEDEADADGADAASQEGEGTPSEADGAESRPTEARPTESEDGGQDATQDDDAPAESSTAEPVPADSTPAESSTAESSTTEADDDVPAASPSAARDDDLPEGQMSLFDD